MLHFSEMRNGMTPTDIQTPYSDTCIFPKCFSWQKVFIIFSSPILSGLYIHTLDPFSVNLTLKPPITTAADSGWLGMAKVSCILCHRGIQLILACSWARSAILIADKDRGGIHAIPHTVRQNLTEFWPFWTPFPIRFSNLTEFSYHLISYFLKN